MTAPTEPEALTDEQTAALALLTAVDAARDTMHRRAATALSAVLAVFAAGADVVSLRLALDPTAPRAERLAAITAELQRQAITGDVVTAWNAVNQAAHADAIRYAAAATGHLLTDGEIPADPADLPTTAPPPPPPPSPGPTAEPEPDEIGADRPSSFVTDGWIDPQLGGLAADVENAIMRGIEDDALMDLLGDAPGALYYLDQLTSQDFIDQTNDIMGLLGVEQVTWTTMLDSRVCAVCLSNADGSPYTLAEVPAVPHGLCRCWILPA